MVFYACFILNYLTKNIQGKYLLGNIFYGFEIVSCFVCCSVTFRVSIDLRFWPDKEMVCLILFLRLDIACSENCR